MSISDKEPKYKVGDGFKSKITELLVIITECTKVLDTHIYSCTDGDCFFFFMEDYLDTYFDPEKEPKYKLDDSFKSRRSKLRVMITEYYKQRDMYMYSCTDGRSAYSFREYDLETDFDNDGSGWTFLSEVVDEKSEDEIALQSALKGFGEAVKGFGKAVSKPSYDELVEFESSLFGEDQSSKREEYSHLLPESYVILPVGPKLIK